MSLRASICMRSNTDEINKFDVCFFTGAESFLNARFGRGTGPLLLDRLGCTGRE